MLKFTSDLLSQFAVFPAVPTDHVDFELLPSDLPGPLRDELMNYHPGEGNDYQVICAVVGSGLEAHLTIDPRGNGWNLKQNAFLRSLRFVPVPDRPIPGRPPRLFMVRPAFGEARLANTNWFLVNASIEKVAATGDKVASHNEVTLIWEYRAGPGEQPYLKPVVSTWRWRSQ